MPCYLAEAAAHHPKPWLQWSAYASMEGPRWL